MPANRATITDLARLCGVSKKTVSRAINGGSGVSPDTMTRILSAAEKIGFQPDRHARALASRRSYVLALAYNNTNAAYVLDLLNGALRVSNAAGYEVIMHPIKTKAAHMEEELSQLVQRSGADGLILTPPLSETLGRVRGLTVSGQPAVWISGSDGGAAQIPQIRFNDQAAAHAVTTHLIELGHTGIGFIGGPPKGGPTRRRLAGFKAALASRGLKHDPRWKTSGDFTFLSGLSAGARILSTKTRPTAIMCCNDEMAVGAIHAARAEGLRVPEQLSVTGFDDAPLAQQVWPPLTTVRQPVEDMGAAAATRLIGLLDQNDDQISVLEFSHTLLKRQSSSPSEK